MIFGHEIEANLKHDFMMMWRSHMWPMKKLRFSPEARTVPELEAPGSRRSLVVLHGGIWCSGAWSRVHLPAVHCNALGGAAAA